MVDTNYVKEKRSDEDESIGTYLEVISVLCGEDLGVDTSLLWNIVLHICRMISSSLMLNYKNSNFLYYMDIINSRNFENTSIVSQ